MIAGMHHLVGAKEIAEMLGVSRQRVTQLTHRDDFPAPVAVLAGATVWKTKDVEAWSKAREKRLGR